MTDFETWLVDEMVRRLTLEVGTLHRAALGLVLDMLAEGGVQLSAAERIDFERTLLDPRYVRPIVAAGFSASSRRGHTLLARLVEAGANLSEVDAFPPLAFRIRGIHDRLQILPTPTVAEVMALGRAINLSSVERRAAEIAHTLPVPRHGGTFLRDAIADAIARREHPREAARLTSNALRKQGTPLYVDEFFRTRMALARCLAGFEHDVQSWPPDTLIFRQTARGACRECHRLSWQPDGFPRLYRVIDLSRGSARWPNHGPRRKWKPTIGPVHGNCTCPPWSVWDEAMRSLISANAPDRAARMQRMGLA
ncbi:MAG: hypothetical protein ABI629_12410 [bacterium]